MKRLILVKPPESSRFNFGAFSLGVLAAAVRHLAYTSILDATRLAVAEAVQSIRSLQPDIVGVTVMGITSVRPVADFLRALRVGGHSRFTVIVGGHGASMLPSHLLSAGADAVIIGEGELTLQEILEKGIRPGIPGMACQVDGYVIAGTPRPPIRPLDQLRSPARDLMPAPPGGVHLMETSRGCPHECAFCEATRFHGRQWRPHTAARVAAEVRGLVQEHDAWTIHFADDNFAASPRRILQICELLKCGPLPALILASARADDLISDPQLLPALAEAHVLRINVGVESVEDEPAARAGKSLSLRTYQETFGRMREQGIFSVASFIVGLPGETPEMRACAVERAIAAGPDSAHFLPFLPLPGVPLAQGRSGYDPDPADARDAHRFTQIFFQHPVVQARLAAAAATSGVRGLLARATLRERGGIPGEGEIAR